MKAIEVANFNPRESMVNIDKPRHCADVLVIIVLALFVAGNVFFSYLTPVEGDDLVQKSMIAQSATDNVSTFSVAINDVFPQNRFARLKCRFFWAEQQKGRQEGITVQTKMIGVKGRSQKRFNYTQAVEFTQSGNQASTRWVDLFYHANLKYSNFIGTITVIGDLSNFSTVHFSWTFISPTLSAMQTFQRIVYSVFVLVALLMFINEMIEQRVIATHEQSLTKVLSCTSLMANNVLFLLTNLVHFAPMNFVDVGLRSFYSGYVIYCNFIMLRRLGNSSDVGVALPSTVASMQGFLMFLYLSTKEIILLFWLPQENSFSLNQGKIILLAFMALCFCMMVYEVILARSRIENSENFKLFAYFISFSVAFFGIFVDLGGFDFIPSSLSYGVPIACGSGVSLIMIYFHFPYLASQNEYVAQGSENPETTLLDDNDDTPFIEDVHLDAIDEKL